MSKGSKFLFDNSYILSLSYNFRFLLPPKVKALAIPIAPIASNLSASCTILPSKLSGDFVSPALNDISDIISLINFISCSLVILFSFKNKSKF